LEHAELDARTNSVAATVVDAAMEVHRTLGPGFLESTYEEALCYELGLRGVAVARQVQVEVGYKGHPVGTQRLDMLVDGRLVVEIKAAETLLPVHSAQLLAYLKATNHRLGLLINFNSRLLKDGLRRIAN